MNITDDMIERLDTAIDASEQFAELLGTLPPLPHGTQFRARPEPMFIAGQMRAYAAAAVAAERERCAAIAADGDLSAYGYMETAGDLRDAIAAAIRASPSPTVPGAMD